MKHPWRKSSILGIATTAAVTLSVVVTTAEGPAGAAPATTSATKSVIVILKDQLNKVPANRMHVAARRVAARSRQDAVLHRLARAGGRKATSVHHYTAADAVSLTVSANQISTLASDPNVAQVIPNDKVAFIPSPATTKPSSVQSGPTQGMPTSPQVCPTDPSKPLLEPEALEDTNTASDDTSAKTAQQLTTGSGVKVGYIADAIDPTNADFIRPNGDHVIVDYKAFSADGPTPNEGGAEAYGDASSIAAQGVVSHDLSTFVNPAYPLPSGCNIRILGMAPGASIVALKIDFYTTSIIQAIDYAVSTDHVDVLNESFGGAPIPDAAARSAISQFNDAAVAAGTTVTVSSGDAGTTSTIGNPSTDPNVISVGADTNSRAYLQTGYAGARAFSNGKWINDEISSLSSGGYTQSGRSVDLVAPGESGWAACEVGAPECSNYRGSTSDFQLFGGTSQSAPLTAGAAALVISAYRSTHDGASPSPALVKTLLTSTATDLSFPTYEQGAGLLNSRAAVEAALTYPGADQSAIPAGVSSNIALPSGQVDISGVPGSTKQVSVPVTNVGTKPLTVNASGQDFVTDRISSNTTSISATDSQTFPYPTNGAPWVYKKVAFSVPSSEQRLAFQAYWAGAQTAGQQPVVRFTLLEPDGTYVANSRPQGGASTANYANLDVRNPTPGTWTLVLYTPQGSTGYTGNVGLRYTYQQTAPVGSVSNPTFNIAPGQTKTINASFRIPSARGDTSYALTVASSDGHQTAVPIIVRTVVPVIQNTGRFTGTITGGNARAGSAAQVFTYSFDVPNGLKDLEADVRLASDPKYFLEGVLVDPHDETQAIDSNRPATSFSSTGAQGLGMHMSAITPAAGRWRVIILVQNPVPGTALSQDFAGTITFNGNQVSSTLPNSKSVVLPAGSTSTAQVQVTNTGSAPMIVQVDARGKGTPTAQLTSPFGPQTVPLPQHSAPTFLVPPGTTKLTATAVSTVPSIVDLLDGTQGIDQVGDLRAAQAGSTVSTVSVQDQPNVATGIWYTDVNEVGSVGPEGAPTGSTTVSLSANTPKFDPAVTSSTGDFWLASEDPFADIGNPVSIAPGQTVTINVSITPNKGAGSVVTGQLYVYTTPCLGYPSFNTTGDVLADLPYSYTVGRPTTR